jgi:hypothetical protein
MLNTRQAKTGVEWPTSPDGLESGDFQIILFPPEAAAPMITRLFASLAAVSILLLNAGITIAQGIEPYPDAITNRLFYPKTPMTPPQINSPFADPDLSAMIVSVGQRILLDASVRQHVSRWPLVGLHLELGPAGRKRQG